MNDFDPITDVDLYEIYYHEYGLNFDTRVHVLNKVCYYAANSLRARQMLRENFPHATLHSIALEGEDTPCF